MKASRSRSCRPPDFRHCGNRKEILRGSRGIRHAIASRMPRSSPPLPDRGGRRVAGVCATSAVAAGFRRAASAGKKNPRRSRLSKKVPASTERHPEVSGNRKEIFYGSDTIGGDKPVAMVLRHARCEVCYCLGCGYVRRQWSPCGCGQYESRETSLEEMFYKSASLQMRPESTRLTVWSST